MSHDHATGCLVQVPANGTRGLWRHDIDGRGSRAGGVKETKDCVCTYVWYSGLHKSVSLTYRCNNQQSLQSPALRDVAHHAKRPSAQECHPIREAP